MINLFNGNQSKLYGKIRPNPYCLVTVHGMSISLLEEVKNRNEMEAKKTNIIKRITEARD